MKLLFSLLLSIAAFAQEPDPQLMAYMDSIKAIDNHAHVYSHGTPNDQGYDALRCEGLPPAVGLPPAIVRFSLATQDTWKALYGVVPTSAEDAEKREPEMLEKNRKAHGDDYYNWLLDKSGVETVLANRVSMAPDLKPPRFRWVPYVDALIFPLNNDDLKKANPDRKALFEMEEQVRAAYLKDVGLTANPPSLDEYLDKVVHATLRRQKDAGAVAVKFEAAYLHMLYFSSANQQGAANVYGHGDALPKAAEYDSLQNFLFRDIAAEAGRLGLAVHIHTGAGCGEFFDDRGSDPMLLANVLNDPSLRGTNFVLLHGGAPFQSHITSLILKPNVYVDTSVLELMRSPSQLAGIMRPWLEVMPEHVLFGTDADFFGPGMNWDETAWLGTHNAKRALAIALTGMVGENVITMARAKEIAELVLRVNAAKLYHLQTK